MGFNDVWMKENASFDLFLDLLISFKSKMWISHGRPIVLSVVYMM